MSTEADAPAEVGTPTLAQGASFARKGLLRLSWPLLVVTVLTLAATLGNVVLLSVSSPELNASVATANQLLGVLYDISVLFSLGALVVVAQHLGAGRIASAQRASIVALRASTVLGVAMALLVALLAAPMVRVINTPQDIADNAVSYLLVVAAGMAFNAYIVAATAVLRAFGHTPALLVLAIVVNVLDVVLLGTFLLVLELGVVGAALPTLLVRGLGALLLAWLVRRHTGVGLATRVPGRRSDGPTGALLMARLSVPSVLENAAYNVAIVVVLASLNVFGTDTINARSYVLTLTALVTGVILALAQGNETIVGWDVGEGTRAHARRLTLRTAAWTAVAAGLLTLLLWLGADAALAVFGAGDDVVSLARDGLLISALLLPLSAITAVVYGALRSAGDVVVPMVYSVATSLVVLLPVAWLLVARLDLGLAGYFWALVAAELVKAMLLVARWSRGTWMREGSVVPQRVDRS